MDEWVYAGALLGSCFATIVFAVSLATYRSVAGRFLRQAGPYFLFPVLAFLALVSGLDPGDALVLFLLAELLYLVFVFLGYVRGLLGLTGGAAAGAAAVFTAPAEPYLSGVLTIGAIYLAFTVTGSLLQRIVVNRKGSAMVLASFLFLSASVVAQVFYEIEGSPTFLRAALFAFLVSVVLFELPLALSVPWGTPDEDSGSVSSG